MITLKSAKAWFEVHKWTSLICTAFLLMLCLTGLPLIFHEEIEHLLGTEPEAPAMATNTPKASLDLIVQKAYEQRPKEVVRYLFWDEENHPNLVLVSMADSMTAAPEASHLVILDERSTKVLAEPNPQEGFMYIMYKLHVDMFAGIPGKLFLGLMGILFFVAIVSGIMLYGPIMRKFDFGMIRTEKSKRLRWLDMHNLLGIVTLTWASVVGLTGVINTLSETVIGLWRFGQLTEMVAPYKNMPKPEGNFSSLEQAVKASREAAPHMKPSIVAFPGTMFSSNFHYAVFMRGNTPLTSKLIMPALVDATTGKLTDMRPMPWYVNTLFLSQPLHFGDYGGLPLKIIWTIFDLATIFVLISGLYLWFARRKALRAQFKRMEQKEANNLAFVLEKGVADEE